MSRVEIALLGPRYEGFNAAFSTAHRKEKQRAKMTLGGEEGEKAAVLRLFEETVGRSRLLLAYFQLANFSSVSPLQSRPSRIRFTRPLGLLLRST